ncbi:restriction endonuclease [Blastococcus atacamensis]|uniref:restriction endonuclease n=1 Tax=Blastococcus atacamensis TaxID=2070508 RepID=UPI0012FFD3A7|nr:restriction endonuclease [Blastococcus atacamensis]
MAEALAAWHMRTIGFRDAEVTQAGVDGGLDVVAAEGAAQVKHYSTSPVGSPAVQQLRGAAIGHQWALFYALSGFTTSAVAFADSASVALLRYTESGDVTPVNAVASHLTERRAANTPSTPNHFQLDQEAAKISQQYVEELAGQFLTSAEKAIEAVRPWGGTHPLASAVMAETDNVQALLSQVNGNRVSVDDIIRVGEQILVARNRLLGISARLGASGD